MDSSSEDNYKMHLPNASPFSSDNAAGGIPGRERAAACEVRKRGRRVDDEGPFNVEQSVRVRTAPEKEGRGWSNELALRCA